MAAPPLHGEVFKTCKKTNGTMADMHIYMNGTMADMHKIMYGTPNNVIRISKDQGLQIQDQYPITNIFHKLY